MRFLDTPNATVSFKNFTLHVKPEFYQIQNQIISLNLKIGLSTSVTEQKIATLSKKLGYGTSEAPNAKTRSSHDILVIKHQRGLRWKGSDWDVTAQVAAVPLC